MHQCVDSTLVNAHVEQAVTGHVQRDGMACCQCHRAELGGDHAVIADIRTQQRHIAAIGVDRAIVAHCALASATKFVVARHEVTISDVQAGGRQPAHIDLRALAKQDAVGVDQKHLAVGTQAAQNIGRIRAQHPVEDHRAFAGLHELHRLARSDIEALPIDDGVLRGLVDGGATRRTADVGDTGSHHAAGRLGQRVGTKREHHRHGQRLQGKAGADACDIHAGRSFFASAAGVLGHSHKGAGAVIPDRSIRAVHDRVQ